MLESCRGLDVKYGAGYEIEAVRVYRLFTALTVGTRAVRRLPQIKKSPRKGLRMTNRRHPVLGFCTRQLGAYYVAAVDTPTKTSLRHTLESDNTRLERRNDLKKLSDECTVPRKFQMGWCLH